MNVERSLAVTTAVAVAFWASLGLAVQALLLLMGLDLLTGLLAARVEQALSSKVGWRGIVRKCLTLAIVAAAAIFTPILANVHPTLGAVPVAAAVAVYFAIVEFLSVIENADRIGVPVPSWLRDALITAQGRLAPAPSAPVAVPPAAPVPGVPFAPERPAS